MLDGFGRKIEYARLSVTDLCTLRCQYCMPAEGAEKKRHTDILSIESFQQIAKSLAALGIEKIRITGGEPFVRRGVDELFRFLGQLDGVKECAVTTNGILLPEKLDLLREAGVTGINVSLDTLNPERYRTVTRGGDFQKAYAGYKAAARAGFAKVKLNAVLLRGINDGEIDDFIALGKEYGTEIRFIELMPFASQEMFAAKHYMGAEEVIARHPSLRYIGVVGNSTAEYYQTPDGVRVGFIRPVSKKFCARCNRVRITADGRLLPCLHGNQAYDLKPHLNEDLTDYMRACILKKQAGHEMEENVLQKRDMNRIGG